MTLIPTPPAAPGAPPAELPECCLVFLNDLANTIYQVALTMVRLEGLVEEVCSLPTRARAVDEETQADLVEILFDLRNRVGELEGQVRNGRRRLAKSLGQPEPDAGELKRG